MKIVDVDHLSFEYGNRRVLHNLNFSIRQGDYAVLTGENGSGKSTLMKVLSVELESAKGRVVIAEPIRISYGSSKFFNIQLN